MPIRTKRIRYNLGDRGFKAHGQPRKFNIPLIVSAINSEATQEQVRARAMVGYYGHWPRVKFGMMASEGGIEGKKSVPVEPALVTTYLRAYDDGTVEHEDEFLDDGEPGKVAARLHLSRVGGFSTVIDEVRGRFIGLDYVIDPNFRNNRGYTLDHANGLTLDDACGLTLDDVDNAIRDEHLHAMSLVLDGANTERELFNMAMARVEAENEQLLSLLGKLDPAKAATFDSARPAQCGLVMDTAGAERMFAMAQAFGSAQLARLNAPPADSNTAPASAAERALQYVRSAVLG